jgi:hypothetical protein
MPWEWKNRYLAALRGDDDGRRPQRMQAAKNAIVDRLEDSLHGRQPLSSAERVQIEEACRELLLLRNHQRASRLQRADIAARRTAPDAT